MTVTYFRLGTRAACIAIESNLRIWLAINRRAHKAIKPLLVITEALLDWKPPKSKPRTALEWEDPGL